MEKKLTHWWDSNKGRPTQLGMEQLNQHLDDISQILNAHIQKLGKVGDWELNEIDIALDVKGDVLVVALDGAVKLTFKKPVATS